MNSVCPSVYSPIYPQKEALSMLDLMLFWLSLLDWVTKLASPFCRRLLWAAFCCLVSCLRTFWRTTSCKTNKNNDSRVLQTTVRSVCLYKAGTTVCRHVGSTTSPPSHSLINCSIWKLFSNTYRAIPALVQNSVLGLLQSAEMSILSHFGVITSARVFVFSSWPLCSIVQTAVCVYFTYWWYGRAASYAAHCALTVCPRPPVFCHV